MNKLIKITYLLSFIIVAMLFTSCGTYTTKMMRTGSFMPNNIELKMTMDDFQYLGDDEVSVEFTKYFGFITVFKLINGKEIERRNQSIVTLEGNGNFNMSLSLNKKLRRALYDVHVKYPTADFIVPVNIISESQGMFLGKSTKQKIKVKAYKIKEK